MSDKGEDNKMREEWRGWREVRRERGPELVIQRDEGGVEEWREEEVRIDQNE